MGENTLLAQSGEQTASPNDATPKQHWSGTFRAQLPLWPWNTVMVVLMPSGPVPILVLTVVGLKWDNGHALLNSACNPSHDLSDSVSGLNKQTTVEGNM
jgi:hypothetical protein